MCIVALQSSWWGRESWLLCLICLPGVLWLLNGSSSRCREIVCGLWLWYFLIILTIFKPSSGHLLGEGWPLGSCLWCLIVFLSLSHVVSWVRCGTWLYRFLIFAAFLLKTYLTAPTSSLVLMWNKTDSCLARMKDPQLIDASSSSTYKSPYNAI